MTDKVKQLAPIIWAEIQKANSILLHCHPSPDGDSIGSVLALMHALKNVGKKVTVIAGDSELPQNMRVLPGSETIEKKNYLEMDPAKFDLFIVLDSSSPDQITKKGTVVFPPTLKMVVIDHHGTNTGYGDINLTDTSYGSVAEIIYWLLKAWTITITKEVAINLFTGIYTDTMFKYERTTSETFAAASELAKIYPEFSRTIFELENNDEPGRVVFIGISLTHIEHYFSNQVAISAVPYKLMQESGLEKKHSEKSDVANILKSVVGWNIAIRFTEIEKDVVSVSFRTRDANKWDVGKIALATGFGGGHSAAAGATLKMPFAEAKKFLLETIAKVYPELGKP